MKPISCILGVHEYTAITDKFRVGREFERNIWGKGAKCTECGKVTLKNVPSGGAGADFFKSEEKALEYVKKQA